MVRPGTSQLDFALQSADRGWRGFQAREAAGTNEPRLVITTRAAAATATPTPTSPAAPAAATDGVQAAKVRSWGPRVAGDEFTYTGAPDATKWRVYNSSGHAGKGLRRPSQVVDGGKVTITGTPNGTTGGMSARFDKRKYGRWETRMRVSARDPKYHPVLILWPDAAVYPCGRGDRLRGGHL